MENYAEQVMIKEEKVEMLEQSIEQLTQQIAILTDQDNEKSKEIQEYKRAKQQQ